MSTKPDSRVVYDVGMHAGDEAMKALLRVTGILPTAPERNGATAIALGYILHKADGLMTGSRMVHPQFVELVESVRKALNEAAPPEQAVRRFMERGGG